MKRLIKLIISIFYYLLVQKIYKLVFFRITKQQPDNIIVLYYHSIPSNKQYIFNDQMDLLLKKTQPLDLKNIDITANDFKKIKRRFSLITFDDAFQSVIQNAVPVLVKNGIPFTIFIPSGQLGKNPEWLKDTKDNDRNEIVATIESLKKLPMDLVTFGSHTINHPRLTLLDEDDAYKEIQYSKKQLELLLDQDIKYFAFPYGDYNEMILTLCSKAGYINVFTINYIFQNNKLNNFEIGRIPVDINDWMIEFKLKISGAYNWMYMAHLLKVRLKKFISTSTIRI